MATRKKTARTAPTSDLPTGIPSLDDLGQLIQKYQLPGIDVAAIVEAQRKDMEALAEANRLAFEGIKTLSERRTEILKDSLAQWQAALQGATGEGGVAKVGEAVKQGVQQAAAHFRELAELEAQTRNDAWKVVQDRFQENVANLQKLLQPK
ncbi:MAG: phasin family protein [Pseudomonadota bacterium]